MNRIYTIDELISFIDEYIDDDIDDKFKAIKQELELVKWYRDLEYDPWEKVLDEE